MRVKYWIISFVVSLLVSTGFAPSLLAQSVLKDHDTNQPIDIDAEQLELKQRDGKAIWKGAVKVNQGNLRLDSDNLTVFYHSEGEATNPTIDRLDARGGVTLKSRTENVQSDWSIYDVVRRLITFGGNVTLTQDDNVVKGERLELNLVTGVIKLDGQENKQNGRVSGRFSIPDSDEEDKKNP